MELSQALFPRTWEALTRAVAEGVAPGVVAGICSPKFPHANGRIAVGSRRVVPSELPMTLETVFDLASLSKVMGTASLMAYLVERRWLRWTTPLKAILPEYPNKDIQLAHLLSHTAGLPAWRPLWETLRAKFGDRIALVDVTERQAEMRRLVMAVEAEARPGEKAVYSDISFLLLGFALEEITGMPLDKAVPHLVWEPMGIQGAFYRRVDRPVGKACLEHVAATEDCPWRGGVLQGQVHDDNAWAMGGYAGHAGVFARCEDVLKFALCWMSGFFSWETRAAMWTRVPLPVGCSRTLGWDTPSGTNPSAGRYFSPRSVGHLGFTGTSLWIDPEAELAVVMLSNRVHPSRANEKIKAFRPVFHDAIRLDLAQYR